MKNKESRSLRCSLSYILTILLIGLLIPDPNIFGSQVVSSNSFHEEVNSINHYNHCGHIPSIFTTDLEYDVATTETKHVVLVSGSFHGAWCWYKVATLLQTKGYTVAAIDLASQGVEKTLADNVTSIAQYAQPVTEYLKNVTGKVVMLGHSLGGVSVTYLMEQFGPEKIAKAMFLASIMPKNNQNFMEASIVGVTIAPPEAQPLHFANGPSNPPTSVGINLSFARQLFYRRSPPEDLRLAKALLVPTPFAVLTEQLHLTPERYGKIPRYYIITGKDDLLSISLQESLIAMNPPTKVFQLNESDHSAFFSQPLQLTELIQLVDSL